LREPLAVSPLSIVEQDGCRRLGNPVAVLIARASAGNSARFQAKYE
jgi:hypothetical protein